MAARLCFAVLLLVSRVSLSQGRAFDAIGSNEAFIGWRGETYVKPSPAVAAAAAAAAAVQDLPPLAPADPATADVEQLQDVAAAHAPPREPSYEEAEEEAGAPAAATATADQHTIDLSAEPRAGGSEHWVQHLSWHPRLHLHHNFLTPAEADTMRSLLARPSHTVGGAAAGAGTAEDEEAALQLMLTIEQRVANWTALPSTHLEGWQLQQGFTGGDRSLHTDLLTDRFATEDFQRYRAATVVLFLGDGSAGRSYQNWSMVFPVARGGAWRGSATPQEYAGILEQGRQVQERLKTARVGRRGAAPNEVLKLHINTHSSLGHSSSDGQGFCDGTAQAGLTLTGFKKGSALLIWNLLTDSQTPDASAAHLFCEGNQQATQPWIATTWMHTMPYGQDSPMALAASCQDNNPACRAWAQQGFCDDAPGLMIGLRGMCRYSCQDCRSCDHLQPTRAPTSPTAPAAAAAPPPGAPKPSVKDYMECLYANMHSLRQEWSEAARSAGVRKARNAIRRDMRRQAGNGFLTTAASNAQQQSAWIH